jgi:class III poly(R)-hydroxyalkanoic acid synthase PhaE subunit
MNQDSQEKNTMDSLMAAWMKSASDFWMSGPKMWPGSSDASPGGLGSTQGLGDRSQGGWPAAFKLWNALFSSLSTPEAMETFFKGASVSPEIFMKMSRTGMEGYAAFYQQWLKKTGNLAQPEKAYHFENLDENVFYAWKELYEKEIQPFLNVPQLGLARSYQERVNEALDRFNLYQAEVAGFLRILYVPVEKSLRVMEEKIEELSKEGKLSENFKEYYDMWIKVLEGHYMTLFKSPEYLKALSNTLNANENFKMARHNMMVDILQSLPIPTNKDMDELYKEIYLLKKTVKDMARKMAEQESST